MTRGEAPTQAADQTTHRFVVLLVALIALLAGYPYFKDSTAGAFLGGVTSLVMLTGAVWALRWNRWSMRIVSLLALATVAASTMAYLGEVRGHPVVEGTFAAFYAFTTFAIFREVITTQRVVADTLYGAICVYLLVGMTFGSLFDMIETLHPGSFQINSESAGLTEIRWRTLIFFSFMTLTTIGYGDITPATTQTQSLAAIEGVLGVLYVAVLIARTVSIYARQPSEEEDE